MKVVPSNILGPDGNPSAYHVLDDEGKQIRSFKGDQAETAAKEYVKKYNTPKAPTTNSPPGLQNKENFSVIDRDPKNKTVSWVETDADGKKIVKKGSFKEYEQAFDRDAPDAADKRYNQLKDKRLFSKWNKFIKGSLIGLIGGGLVYVRINETLKQNEKAYQSVINNPTLSDAQKQAQYNKETKENWRKCTEDVFVAVGGTLAGSFITAVTYLGYAKYARAAALATGAAPFNWPGLVAFGVSAGITYGIEQYLESKKREIYDSTWKEFMDRGVQEGLITPEQIPDKIKKAKTLTAKDQKSVLQQIKTLQNKEPNKESELITPEVAAKAKETRNAFKKALQRKD